MKYLEVTKTIEEYFEKKGLPLAPALTFEDVTIVDLFSDIPSRSAIRDTRGHIAQSIFVTIPIVSANMDTVTESHMAIAMARHGGIGFIHQFLPIQKRRQEVELVKRADSSVIEKPLTLAPDAPLGHAKELMGSYQISSLLVVDEKTKKLIGILSNRDYQFEEDDTKKIGSLMKIPGLPTALPLSNIEKASPL